MADLTYRGRKYSQTKSTDVSQEVYLKYCGYELMSKKIHETMKAEMGYKLTLSKVIFIDNKWVFKIIIHAFISDLNPLSLLPLNHLI